MPQNIFKIFNGRTNFWQWDTCQKLIVLDESVTSVHFSNRDMNHSITKYVYEENGMRLVNVPDIILQLPRNLVAYAYAENHTVKSVKFAVIKRPIPEGYVMNQTEELDEINHRLEILENVLKDIEVGSQELRKFESITEAETWAQTTQKSGIIVAIRINTKWIAHMIEDDFTVTPICDKDGNKVEINMDGGDSDGYTEEEKIEAYIWDGGSAAGI